LELLKKGCDEVLKAFDNDFKKELVAYQGKPYKIHHAEVNEKIRKIKKLIRINQAGEFYLPLQINYYERKSKFSKK